MRHHFILAKFFQAYDELTPFHSFVNVDLRRTKVTSLGNLKYVIGLNISETNITSLGNLQYVGGNFYIGRTTIISFGNLKGVGGYVVCDKGEQYDRLQVENDGRFKVHPL